MGRHYPLSRIPRKRIQRLKDRQRVLSQLLPFLSNADRREGGPGRTENNTEKWGGRVRKIRDAKGRPIILKRVHHSDTLIQPHIAADLVKRISRHTADFNHEYKHWMRKEKIRLINPHIDVLGDDLIAMPVINAPTVEEFRSLKKYFKGEIKPGARYESFQHKAEIFSIRFVQFMYERYGLELGKDDIFFLGFDKNKNMIFTCTGDV
jgi:hypothetical protein